MRTAICDFTVATPSGVVHVTVGDVLPDSHPAVRHHPRLFTSTPAERPTEDAGDDAADGGKEH